MNQTNVQDLSFLIVDDDDTFLGLLGGVLQSLGATKVIPATTGSDALTKLAASSRGIDCVLCDLKMPSGNGLQLLQAIRLGMVKSVRPDCCFIFVTAAADAELIKAAGQLDASGYVVKPVTRDKVLTAIVKGRARGFALNVNQYRSVRIPEVA